MSRQKKKMSALEQRPCVDINGLHEVKIAVWSRPSKTVLSPVSESGLYTTPLTSKTQTRPQPLPNSVGPRSPPHTGPYSSLISASQIDWWWGILVAKLNSVASVRERTIPTERPPLVSEVNANFCWWRVPHGQGDGSLQPYSRFSR
jgi:hypothetical protein